MPRITTNNFSPNETGWVVVLKFEGSDKTWYAIPGYGPGFYAKVKWKWMDCAYALLPADIRFAYKFDTLANAMRFAHMAGYCKVEYYCPEMLTKGAQ